MNRVRSQRAHEDGEEVAAQVYGASPVGSSPRRGSRLRIDRSRLIAVEAVAGLAIVGGTLGGAVGWSMIFVAALVLLLTLGRRDGRWLTELMAARLRGGTATNAVVAAPPEPTTKPRGAADQPGGAANRPDGTAGEVRSGTAEFGAVAEIVPQLMVTECSSRNGDPVGVAWDGQGFAAALELDSNTRFRLDLGRLVASAATDDVPLASVQLLIEQLAMTRMPGSGVVRSAGDPWPGVDLPLLRRAWIAVRYEPSWAPEAAMRRGEGGADGARLAVAASLARLRVRILEQGPTATPLDAAGLTRTIRTVGDPATTGTLHREHWTPSPARHHCLGATVGSPADWLTLLRAVSRSPAERTVLSLSIELNAAATRSRAAIRLVGSDHAAVRQAQDRLLATGLASPLLGAQAAGVLATLPLGGGPRPSTGAIGWMSR
ncbi:type VII secretion protein EccE [Plantactinospora siamensis]|uniref:Type VII secretion protein EccE n=1 Tax=Plantactinospora siamensis TaxID=555372 RepID=A0ABV6NR94_9ACTN